MIPRRAVQRDQQCGDREREGDWCQRVPLRFGPGDRLHHRAEVSIDQPDASLRARVRKQLSDTRPVKGEEGDAPVDQDREAGGDPIPEQIHAGMLPAPRESFSRRAEGEGKLEENQQANQSDEGDGGVRLSGPSGGQRPVLRWTLSPGRYRLDRRMTLSRGLGSASGLAPPRVRRAAPSWPAGGRGLPATGWRRGTHPSAAAAGADRYRGRGPRCRFAA